LAGTRTLLYNCTGVLYIIAVYMCIFTILLCAQQKHSNTSTIRLCVCAVMCVVMCSVIYLDAEHRLCSVGQ
jgi:hypothetical protein